MKTSAYAVIVLKFASAATCLSLNIYRLYTLYPFNAITFLDVLAIITTAIAGHYLGTDAVNSLKNEQA